MTDTEKKQLSDALSLAFEVATPIAKANAAQAADGEFLKLLLELIKILLPILLELLKPKV